MSLKPTVVINKSSLTQKMAGKRQNPEARKKVQNKPAPAVSALLKRTNSVDDSTRDSDISGSESPEVMCFLKLVLELGMTEGFEAILARGPFKKHV